MPTPHSLMNQRRESAGPISLFFRDGFIEIQNHASHGGPCRFVTAPFLLIEEREKFAALGGRRRPGNTPAEGKGDAIGVGASALLQSLGGKRLRRLNKQGFVESSQGLQRSVRPRTAH